MGTTPANNTRVKLTPTNCDTRVVVAAIDLGSNSFNLLICQWQDGELHRIAHRKDIVQLSRDIACDGSLHQQAMQRALDCLGEFRKILDEFQPTSVEVIGTEALRRAPNAQLFLAPAHSLLGTPVSIISSGQEAELGYLGVQHFHRLESNPLLVVDIGGASTELTLGMGNKVQHWHSFKEGCVSLANRFFQNDDYCLKVRKIDASYRHCRKILDREKSRFALKGAEKILGASGIMRVIADLLDGQPDELRAADLQFLLREVAENQTLRDNIPASLRHDVLPAGIVLLLAIFDSLGIESMQVSQGNVKQGMILQRLHHLGVVADNRESA